MSRPFIDDLFSLEGKSALVTGGSRGIGLMIATGLVDAGVRVYVASRKADVCQAVAAQLSERGECIAVPADLGNPEGVEALAAEVGAREPALNILVNNAGIAWGAGLDEHPLEAFDKLYNVNVKAPFHLTRLLRPNLQKAGSHEDPSRVINVGSINGIAVPDMSTPMMENYSYSTSKAAIHMLTRHLAHRLAGEHITVNALAMGFYPSKMTEFMAADGGEAVAQHVPMRRIGRLSDAAGATIFLSSRAGSYLTGVILPVDGGISTHG